MNGLVERVRILRPLRHRDFRLLWTGMTTSLIGDGIFLVSLAWQVYELSNTPDRALDRRRRDDRAADRLPARWAAWSATGSTGARVMIAADALRALSVATLGLLSIAPGEPSRSGTS